MTGLEIIDTAVKIGLGALIGGVFAYLMARLTFKQDITKTKLEAKSALVKEAALKYEEAIFIINENVTKSWMTEGKHTIEFKQNMLDAMHRSLNAISHAESYARLASLVDLANCFDATASCITEIFNYAKEQDIAEGIDMEKANEMIGKQNELAGMIRGYLASAYDEIYK